jgi:uncharacterized protein YacL
MDFLTLFLILLGMFGGVFIRAIIKNGANFDFLLWLKYDLNRLLIGVVLSIIAFAIQTFAPEAVIWLESFGLKIGTESAIITGNAIALFVVSLPTNNPK